MQDYNAVYNKALRYLTRREHAKYELELKLGRFCQDSEIICQVIKDCIDQGFLSDVRYALHYVEVKSKYAWGPVYIRYNLQKLHIDSSAIDAAITAISNEEWLDNGCKWLVKRVGVNNSWNNNMIEKLLRRGFSCEQILLIKKRYLELD